MPPKPKPAAAASQETRETSLSEDLVAALQDARVIDAIGKALAPLIALSIDEGIKKHLEGVTVTIREVKP